MQAAQAIDVAEWLPNDLLVKLDRCLMAHGVEGRTPFLDPKVAAFAFRLPDASKAGLRFGKILLREWLARRFPQAGAYARKKGFKPPVGAWMQARARELSRLSPRSPAWWPCCPPRPSRARSPAPATRRSRPGACCSTRSGTAAIFLASIPPATSPCSAAAH